jgi:hypothetical protein
MPYIAWGVHFRPEVNQAPSPPPGQMLEVSPDWQAKLWRIRRAVLVRVVAVG